MTRGVDENIGTISDNFRMLMVEIEQKSLGGRGAFSKENN